MVVRPWTCAWDGRCRKSGSGRNSVSRSGSVSGRSSSSGSEGGTGKDQGRKECFRIGGPKKDIGWIDDEQQGRATGPAFGGGDGNGWCFMMIIIITMIQFRRNGGGLPDAGGASELKETPGRHGKTKGIEDPGCQNKTLGTGFWQEFGRQ